MMKKKINLLTALFLCFAANGYAADVSMNTAIMQAMDKITGHVDLIEVPVNQEVLFGSFSILVRDCKTSAPEETPENFAFVDIVDNISSDAKINIFKGWMVSSSPALNPVAHPVYDVWLLKCSNKPSGKIKPMSEKELALRDDIDMNRAPKKEIISLEKDVYDDIESELQQVVSAPENLIPEVLVEEQVQPVEPKIESENIVIENSVIQDNSEDIESARPEALVIIKEEPREKVETADSDESVLSNDDVSDSTSETDIIELEKELSEKVISD